MQLGETNGFRVSGRFRVLSEIITAICKLTAVLVFIVLSDLCDVPDLLCVMVQCLRYQTGIIHVSWSVFTVVVIAAKCLAEPGKSEEAPVVRLRRLCIAVIATQGCRLASYLPFSHVYCLKVS
jgi:hypothetical protein